MKCNHLQGGKHPYPSGRQNSTSARWKRSKGKGLDWNQAEDKFLSETPVNVAGDISWPCLCRSLGIFASCLDELLQWFRDPVLLQWWLANLWPWCKVHWNQKNSSAWFTWAFSVVPSEWFGNEHFGVAGCDGAHVQNGHATTSVRVSLCGHSVLQTSRNLQLI